MSASTAIGMVSASLRNLLLGEMRLTPPLDVTILAPDETGSERRINLFLYKLAENPFLKNQDVTVKPGSPNQLVPAPLSLNLFYLMTPYAPNDSQTGNASAHQILGEAMRVFYENPVVPKEYLDAGLTACSGAPADREQCAGSGGAEQDLDHVFPAVPAVRAVPGLDSATRPTPGLAASDAQAGAAGRRAWRTAAIRPARGLEHVPGWPAPPEVTVTFTGEHLRRVARHRVDWRQGGCCRLRR